MTSTRISGTTSRTQLKLAQVSVNYADMLLKTCVDSKCVKTMLTVRYVKYAFGNIMHYNVQPRHLHYTDVMLYHV